MNKTNDVVIEEYKILKNNGFTPERIFVKAKNQGYKNFECMHILMAVFNIELAEARKVSHYLYRNYFKH